MERGFRGREAGIAHLDFINRWLVSFGNGKGGLGEYHNSGFDMRAIRLIINRRRLSITYVSTTAASKGVTYALRYIKISLVS